MSHEKLVYKGKEIFLFDHSGLRDEALLKSLQAAMKIILDSPETTVLCLADFSNTYISPEVMSYLQSAEAKMAAKKTQKTATVGVTGIKGIFMNTYNMVTKAGARNFTDRLSAQEYLVS